MTDKVKVLVVDDSMVVCKALSDILNSDPKIEVIATAYDPFMAVKEMKKAIPDVITLDIEMPKMDGVTFLRRIMSQCPIPVIICSSLAEEGAEVTLQALEAGALDIILKNKLALNSFFEENRTRICEMVKGAAKASLRRFHEDIMKQKLTENLLMPGTSSPDPEQTFAMTPEAKIERQKTVLIGASSCGTYALKIYLVGLPADAPGTVIVQHIPEGLSKSLARQLNNSCLMSVKEAQDGDEIVPGKVLLAPGNRHLMVKRNGNRNYVELREGPLVNFQRPSVDVMFRSAARYLGADAVGVILSGTGEDGAKGMLELKNAGAFTITQDENSSIIFDMARQAIDLGGVQEVLPLTAISRYILSL